MRRCTSRHVDARLAHVALAALLLVASACGGSGADTGPATGMLAVAVSAPGGVSTPISVSGPDGYAQTLSGTQTLVGLSEGSYTVTASAGASGDPIVGNLYAASVSGSPASVIAGSTASATVTYATTGTPGHLWIANSGGNAVGGYSAAQLASSGTPAPAITIGASHHAGANAQSMAIDGSGGMWISDNSDTLVYFTAAQIASSTTAAPTRVLVDASGTVSAITGIAFDGQGNL